MAKFPRRGTADTGRTYVVVGLCLVLALFAISSRSSWLRPSTAPEAPHVEGRSLQATDTGSKFSLFSSTGAAKPSNDAQGDDVLVMYLYDNRDPVWVENFKFFVQWGIAANDGCSYIILVNEALYAAKVCKPDKTWLSVLLTYAEALGGVHRRHYQATVLCLPTLNLFKQIQRTAQSEWECSVRLWTPPPPSPMHTSITFS